MARIKKIDSKARLDKHIRDKKRFDKTFQNVTNAAVTASRKTYIMSSKFDQTTSDDEVSEATTTIETGYNEAKTAAFDVAWKRKISNDKKKYLNSKANDLSSDGKESKANVSKPSTTIKTEETTRVNTVKKSNETRQTTTTNSQSRTVKNNAPKRQKLKETRKKTAKVNGKKKYFKRRKKAVAKPAKGNVFAKTAFSLKLSAILLLASCAFVAVVFVFAGIITVVGNLNPLGEAESLSLVQACKIKEEGYQREIIDCAGQRIQNLGDGYAFPIIVNQDINWREVIAVYLAYTSDKELKDPNTRFKVAGTDYHYFETVFNECNLILTQYNREYYLNDNGFSLYYLDTSKEHNPGDLSDTAIIEFTRATIIICSHPNAKAVAEKLEFNESELELLDAYLNDDQYNEYFNNLTSLIASGDGADIITLAMGEENNDWHKYCQWFTGQDSRFPWCAAFVSWAANYTGYYESGLFPRSASCKEYYDWYNNPNNPGTFIYTYNNVEYQKTLNIQPGWLIIWERDDDHTVLSHIGIVTDYDPDKKLIYTIEGNSGDKVATRVHCAEDEIWGFCCPAYPVSSFGMYDYFSIQLKGAISLGSEWEIFESSDELLKEVFKSYKIPGWATPVVNEIISLTEAGIDIPDEVYKDYVDSDDIGCYDYWLETKKILGEED